VLLVKTDVMKRLQTERLIEDLKADVNVLLEAANFFKSEIDACCIPPTKEQWSIAQIFEHLNMFNRHYLPAIDKALTTSPPDRQAWFTPGIMGNRFVNTLAPKDVFEIKKKYKAPKGFIAENNLNPQKVLDEFITHQHKLLQLLELAKERNLGTIRIPSSISKLIKFKLGDTFRFLIAHEQRHIIQARNALKTIGLSTDKFPAVLRGVPQ
jgi:hypothetical protein